MAHEKRLILSLPWPLSQALLDQTPPTSCSLQVGEGHHHFPKAKMRSSTMIKLLYEPLTFPVFPDPAGG